MHNLAEDLYRAVCDEKASSNYCLLFKFMLEASVKDVIKLSNEYPVEALMVAIYKSNICPVLVEEERNGEVDWQGIYEIAKDQNEANKAERVEFK